MDILDYLQQDYPDAYERTRYNIIEISEKLATQQRTKLSVAHPCVTVHNKSVFRWDTREPAPCYFLAMEVVVSRSVFHIFSLCMSTTPTG